MTNDTSGRTIYLTIYTDPTTTMPSFPITFYRPPAEILAEVDEFLFGGPATIVTPPTPKQRRKRNSVNGKQP